MKKNIRDYLHLYPGCEVLHNNGDSKYNGLFHITSIQEDGIVVMRSNKYPGVKFSFNPAHDKPLFRKLSSMTEEEAIQYVQGEFGNDSVYNGPSGWEDDWLSGIIKTARFKQSPEGFRVLLKQGFWLFGEDWFDEGLILDKDTVK